MEKFIHGFIAGQKSFGETIAVIINSVLLSLVYIFGVGLTSIIAKLLGKSFLDLKKEKVSYWRELNLGKEDIKNYYKQF